MYLLNFIVVILMSFFIGSFFRGRYDSFVFETIYAEWNEHAKKSFLSFTLIERHLYAIIYSTKILVVDKYGYKKTYQFYQHYSNKD